MASLADPDPYTTLALKSPPGKEPNLTQSPSSQSWLVAIGVLCLTFAVVFISARTFVKTYIIKKTQIEDYALMFAGLAFAAFVAVCITAGNARQAMRVLMLSNIVEILYGPTMFPAKLCVLMQMLRIFRGTKKDSVYWAILVLIWSNFVFYVTITFFFVFACVPRAKSSTPMYSGTGSCIKKTNPLLLATSAINVASDFSILFLPVFAVWKLKIALKRKLTISAVFGTGLFACITSIMRLVYSVHLALTKGTNGIDSVLMWAFAEITTVILAGAFPTIPRLMQWLRGHTDSPSYVQPRQKTLKPSYVTISNGMADVEAGAAWRGTSLVTAKRDSSIPLEQAAGWTGQGSNAKGKPDFFGKGLSVPPKCGWEAREGLGEGVFKTVRIETSYSP